MSTDSVAGGTTAVAYAHCSHGYGTAIPSVIVVATDDSGLLDRILSITAAVGIEPLVVNEPQLLRPVWASAAMVLVGADQAARMPRSA